MRTNKTKKQLVFNVARLMLLAICFVTVFALALSQDSIASGDGIFGQIAKAITGQQTFIEKDDDATLGTASLIYGDHDELDAMDFGYPLGGTTSGTTRTWTFTETFNTIVPTTSNHGVAKNKGNTKLYTWVGGDPGEWCWGISNQQAYGAYTYGVINYNPGTFLSNLFVRPDVKVYASFTANIYRKANPTATLTDSKLWSAAASPEGISAENANDLRANGGNQTKFQESDTAASERKTSNEVLLSKDNPIFSIIIAREGNQKWGGSDINVGFTNLSISFRIVMDNSLSDNANLVIRDGSAPVVASQYVSGITDIYAPYLSSTNQTTTLSYGSYSWPVWNTAIQSQLTNHVDRVTNANGSMLSYTNKSLGKDSNGKNYYKQSVTTYVDTYDYSGSGGFSASNLLSIYNTAIQNGSTEAQARAKVLEVAKYMSVGMKTVSGINFDNFDINNVSGNISWGSGDRRYVSGIKTVQIGDRLKNMDVDTSGVAAVFNIYEMSDGASQNKEIYVDGKCVGLATVKRTNRAQVEVTVRMYTNARVRTTVSDYGDAVNSTDINYKGIDLSAPSIGTRESGATNSGVQMDLSDYIASIGEIDGLKWYRDKFFENGTSVEIFEDDTDAGFSPYIWYYTVNRADSISALPSAVKFDTYQSIVDAGLKPIAYGDITKFDYNFATGAAKSYGSSQYDAFNFAPLGNMTGAGYYRFTFYQFDLTGNKGGDVSYYVKVDYDTPQYTINLSFVDDATGQLVTIGSRDNGMWATGKTTLTITLDKPNFSGNTFLFEDMRTTHMFVIDGIGDPVRGGMGGLVRYGNSIQMKDTGMQSVTFTIESNLQTILSQMKVTQSGESVSITFEFDDPQVTIAFISQFVALVGQYRTTIEPDSDDMAIQYVNPAWGEGVQVLIDRIAPMMPELNDPNDTQYLFEFAGYSVPSDRTWFTDGYTFESLLTFSDNLVNSDYASGIVVYAGMKTVRNQAELDALKALGIESAYASIDMSNFTSYFDRLQTLTGDTLDGDETAWSFDIVREIGAGLRVYYVWVVDQAGNCSAISTYYLFADGTTYVVRSGIKVNAVLGATASIFQTNADGDEVTSFKRGDSVMLTMGVDEGYVPFTLTQVANDQRVQLLNNYSAKAGWSISNHDYAQLVEFAPARYTDVQYKLDDPFNVGALPSITNLEFAHRQVISYTITNNKISYTSQSLVIPMTLNNDAARNSFEYVYVLDAEPQDLILYARADGGATENINEAVVIDGVPQLFVPKAVDSYLVRVFIDKENESFVTSDFTMDENGVQTFNPIAIEIIKGNAIVRAIATRSVYGDPIALRYELEGIVEDNLASEGINFAIELKIDGFNPANIYNVGTYQIVANGLVSDYANYYVEYISAYHTISRRDVNVQTWSASKVYGDVDPEFVFGVGQNQFEGQDISAVLQNIFGGFGYVADGNGEFDGETFYLFKAGNRISRAVGEAVGEYEYTANNALFDVNGNFNIIVQNTQHFTITQRTVVVDVSGQSSILPFGSVIDTSLIKPSYALSAIDSTVASEVAQLLNNQLSLALEGTVESDPQYSEVHVFDVLLATSGNGNIKLVLGDNAKYLIYITLQNAVIVSLKDGAVFEFVYGLVWDDAQTILYNANMFDVKGELPSFADIRWTATISTGNGSTPNVGGYVVSVSNAKLIGEDGEELPDAVFVETFAINVVPALITVKPTVQTTQKTYGDLDSVFGIGFAIDTVAGSAFGVDDVYAGVSHQDLLSAISGSFARARFTSEGSMYALGSRYDDATHANGIIIDTTLGVGQYYGIATGNNFACQNNNFVVETVVDDTIRFVINPKELVLHTKDLVGVNKSYDGSRDVTYGATEKAYDFASQLVRADDQVELDYDAKYGTEGSSQIARRTQIIFRALDLVGASKDNYVLTLIVNDGMDTTIDGSILGGQFAPDQITTIEIYYIDNNNSDNPITIYMGTIGLMKSNITVSKQYDNSQRVTMEGITIANVSADGIGTTILYQIAQNGNAFIIEEESSIYSNVLVGNNYIITTLAIFFPIDGADGIQIVSSGAYYDRDVTVKYDEYNNQAGIKVELTNMQASITQRKLNASSFESVEAVTRDYNATGVVNTTFTLAPNALADGDTLSSIELSLMAEITDGNFNAGNHPVRIAPVVESEDGVNTFIGNSNYTVDVDALNIAFEGRVYVTIERAKLLPNIRFVDKEYDNSVQVDIQQNPGLPITTLHYSTNLRGELACFEIANAPTYQLSIDGKADPNVTADLLHNVLVSGLSIVEIGDNNYLRNYEIYGSRYSNGMYNTVGSVVSGVIEDFEMIDVVNVTKKLIPVIANNVEIKDKVYDGTKDAVVTVKLPEEFVVEDHLDKLQIIATGEFARRQVGNNITVNIYDVQLVALNEEGEALLHNYQLAQYRGKHTSNIIPRPVVLNADLGEKTYNGLTDIQKSSITYSYDGILENEQSNYAIQTKGGAYYIDANVEVERAEDGHVIYRDANGEILNYVAGHYYDAQGNHAYEKYATVLEKSGIIVNPVLANTKERYINYVLTQASTDGSGDYIAYRDINGDMHYYEKAQNADEVQEYYYTLSTTDKYLAYNASRADIDAAMQAGAIVGFYGKVGSRGYILKADYEGPGVRTMPEIIYFNAYGKINQRDAYIKADGIKKTNNATAFTKEFDATAKFFGTRTDGPDGDGDYYYVEGSIANVIGDDDVEIEDIFAEFDRTDTNAMYVVFTVSGIMGSDAYNYATGSTVATTRLHANITKRPIETHLADGVMTYGTNPSNADGEITYYLHGFELDWNEKENAFFIPYDEYLVAFYYVENVGDTYKESDYVYLQNALSRSYHYDEATDTYIHAEEGVVGEYIRLLGNFSTPRSSATFNSSRPTVGMTSNSFRIVGGDATNYVFAPHYTGTGVDGTSSIEVVKKNLFITTDGIEKSKVYGLNDPVITLNYFDENGNLGIVSGETWMSIFKIGNVDYRPIARLAVYNSTTGEITPCDQYAKLNEDLNADEYYVYYLEAPNGVDYEQLVKNYNIILGTLTHEDLLDEQGNVMLDANGKAMIKAMFEYEGFALKTQTSQLTITLPVLTNVSVRANENSYVYARDDKGQGINRVFDVVLGATAQDQVRYVTVDAYGNETEHEAVNAGVHTGIIKVRRYITVDEGDTNGYYIEWVSDQTVTITIERASINPKASPVVSYYTGNEQQYELSGSNNKFTYDYISLPPSEINVLIEKNVNGVYQSAVLKDAGTYRVTISMKDTFEASYPNFKAETVQTTFTILRAVVNIQIDTTDYEVSQDTVGGSRVTKLSAMYDPENDYDIAYSISMDNSVKSDCRISVSDTELVFAKEITQPGRYTFTIGLSEDCTKDIANYNFVGSAGLLELRASTLQSATSNIQISDNGIVANKLVVKQLKDTNSTSQEIAYVDTISKFMPQLAKEGGFKKGVRLSAVVSVGLYCDDRVVVLDGEQATLSVALPDTIDDMKNIAVYYVTRQGGLKKLTDYQIVDGNIVYSTDYVSSLVFVDVSQQSIAPWIIYVIIGVGAFLALVVIVTIVALVARKSKLKRLM